MHKSVRLVFTFGLLASSLVMLAAIPMLNNNSFTKTAMAQGYYGDSSNYYSQYPTEDKKYECQTGSLEGFFTSSVEFCKQVKFDDKKNRDGKVGPQGPVGVNGTQGPTGPQGIQGIQGPTGPNGTQGPSGITFINSTTAYLVNSTLTINNSTSFNTGRAICDPGDFVIEGGYTIDSFTVPPYEFLERPIFSPLGSGWEVILAEPPENPDSAVGWFTHAICFDNPPLK